MKCPSCKTKIGSTDYKDDPWAKVDKNGEGYYLCPSCGKSLVHRWVIGPSFIIFLIAAGVLSEALAFVLAMLVNTVLALPETASDFVTYLSYAMVFGAVCLHLVQPVEVTAE